MKFLLCLLPAVITGATTTILGLGSFIDPGVVVERLTGQTVLAGVALDVPMAQVKEARFQFAWSDEILTFEAFEPPAGVTVKTDLKSDGPIDRLTVTISPAAEYTAPFLGWAKFICGRATFVANDDGSKKPGPVALTARNVTVTYDDGVVENIPDADIFNPDRLWTKRLPAKAAVRLVPRD